MIEEIATVHSVDIDSVRVVTTKSSACHQCNEADSCSTSILSQFFGNKEIELQLTFKQPLNIGDKVLLGIEENVFLRLTLLIYLLPLCCLFVFSMFGSGLAVYLSIDNEVPILVSALIGFFGCYFAIKYHIKHHYNPEKINPVILRKL